MSTNIASKNAYELLGNDPDQDSDREPDPPTKVKEPPVQRTGKRNAGGEGPSGDASRGVGGGRGGGNAGFTRADQAGAQNNRGEQRDDGARGDRGANRTRGPRGQRGGADRGDRGGRGGRGYGDRYARTNRDDRQNHSGHAEHEKQVAHGWGGEDGNSEWKDEVAGEAIAKAEANDDAGFTPDVGSGDPAFANGPGAAGEVVGEDALGEPEEEKTKSYDEYLAEQKEKRAALGGDALQVRKPNEGSKQKFPEGTAVNRTQEDFFAGSGGKARREKTQQKKEQLQLDGQYYAAADSGESRGGRGGRGRGGRGRGDGDRAERGERGEGRGRGGRGRGEGGERAERGGRGRGRGEGFRGERGGFRGDRGGDRGGNRGGPRSDFNATDQSAFPALGGS